MKLGERRHEWGWGLALVCALASACFRDDGPGQLCEGAACGLTGAATQGASSTGEAATAGASTGSTGELTTGTADSSTGEPVDRSVTFRIDSLAFIDPHLFLTTSDDPPVCGSDVTSFVNLSLGGDAKSGKFNLLARFEDFNGVNEMRLIDADCEDPPPGGRRRCWPNPNAQVVLLATQRPAEGGCRQLDPTVYQPITLPDIHDPQVPCVRSNRVDFSVPVNDSVGVLGLRQAQFSARIVDVDAPERLEDGLLSGFLSQKAAEALVFENDIVGKVTIWSLINAPACAADNPDYLPSIDEAELDKDLILGVWLAINFTAERVDYVAMP